MERGVWERFGHTRHVEVGAIAIAIMLARAV
jgi:hypothetical protein